MQQMPPMEVVQPTLTMQEEHQSSVIHAVNQHGHQTQTYPNQHKEQNDQTDTRPSIYHHHNHHQVNQHQVNQISQLTDTIQQATFQSQIPTTTTSTIQGNFQNVLNLQRQQIAEVAAAQNQEQHQQQLYVKPQSPVQQPFIPAATIHGSSTFGSEFNPTSTATSTSTSSSGKSQVRVCINRLNVEDARLMQQSIKKFVQKSPEYARNLGLLQESTTNKHNDSQRYLTGEFNSVPTTEATNAASAHSSASASVDMFTVIKADEKRSGTKRKLAISLGDIPPEQICEFIFYIPLYNLVST